MSDEVPRHGKSAPRASAQGLICFGDFVGKVEKLAIHNDDPIGCADSCEIPVQGGAANRVVGTRDEEQGDIGPGVARALDLATDCGWSGWLLERHESGCCRPLAILDKDEARSQGRHCIASLG